MIFKSIDFSQDSYLKWYISFSSLIIENYKGIEWEERLNIKALKILSFTFFL